MSAAAEALAAYDYVKRLERLIAALDQGDLWKDNRETLDKIRNYFQKAWEADELAKLAATGANAAAKARGCKFHHQH